MSPFKRVCFFVPIMAIALYACGGAPTVSAPTAAEVESTTPAEPVATQALVATEALATEASAEPIALRFGWIGKPDTLNPAYAFLTESYTVFDLIYGTLVTESPSGEYVGELAQDWSVSEDGLTWTFTLKDGITWHNGEPFTVDQMVWAINAVMQNPEGWATTANYVNGFKEVKALDEKTLQISLENPVGNLEYRTSFLYAVYPPDFERFTTAEELQNFANDQPIGTGAFKVANFDKDKGILILEAHKNYHNNPPKIDQIIFQTFDNADAMVQALKVGDVDLIHEVPNSAFQAVQSFPNVKAIRQPGRGLAELIINSVPADHDPAPNRNPALEDPQVRLAIAHAINKQDLVEIVLQGLGQPGTTIIPPSLGGGFWHNPLPDIPFDLELANQILDQAGYVMEPDGVRAKDGIKLEMRLQYASDSSVYPRVADLISGWMRQIGIRATPEAVDPDSLTAALTPTGDYDLVIWGWGSDPDPDFMLSVMTSEQFVEGGWSDSGYSNPEYDQLYLEQQTTVDRAQRRQIIWRMQEMVFNDRPYIVLYYEDSLEAYRTDRFTGFIESPLGIEASISLRNVEPVQ